MAQGRVRKGVEKSIRAAVNSGNLDLEIHGAPLAMLRYMADFLDKSTGETPPTRYVTPASFLTYCETLGLTPSDEPSPAAETAPSKPASSLGEMRGKFKSVS